jgi:hypothetical protein
MNDHLDCPAGDSDRDRPAKTGEHVTYANYDHLARSYDDAMRALRLCDRALSHNSIGEMDEDELASARFAARVAIARYEDSEAAK